MEPPGQRIPFRRWIVRPDEDPSPLSFAQSSPVTPTTPGASSVVRRLPDGQPECAYRVDPPAPSEPGPRRRSGRPRQNGRLTQEDRTTILGECSTARHQHAGAERVEGEEGCSLEREDASIPGSNADQDSAEDQPRPRDIARPYVDGDEPRKPGDPGSFMPAEPRVADECECEREEGDASCSESSQPSPRHQIADGDTGGEDRGDQKG